MTNPKTALVYLFKGNILDHEAIAEREAAARAAEAELEATLGLTPGTLAGKFTIPDAK